jgi:hypothetical protein
MTIIFIFLVKLSFDIGHESPMQGLNGWVHGNLARVHMRLEFVCVFRDINYAHMEI